MTPVQNRLCADAYASTVAAVKLLQLANAKVPPASQVSLEVDAALQDLDRAKGSLEALLVTTFQKAGAE